jgi:hypothetical protein
VSTYSTNEKAKEPAPKTPRMIMLKSNIFYASFNFIFDLAVLGTAHNINLFEGT